MNKSSKEKSGSLPKVIPEVSSGDEEELKPPGHWLNTSFREP